MEIQLRDRSVRIGTGGRDHADQLEDPAVVLIHGSGMDRTTWQMQSRWLAHHGHRVAAVDLPGHGLSDGPPLESISEMGEWLVEVIAELDVAPAHLVGFSLGTYVALEAASRAPEMVRSAILIGTAATMPVHPDLLAASRDDVRTASRLMTSWSFSSRAHRGGHRSPGMWMVGGSTALIDRATGGVLAADMEACAGYMDAVATAAKVSVPVTFVLGAEDKMTPRRASTDLIEAVANQQVIVMPGVGHMMPTEAPIDTRKAIVDAIAWAGT